MVSFSYHHGSRVRLKLFMRVLEGDGSRHHIKEEQMTTMESNRSHKHCAALSPLASLKIDKFTYEGWRDDYQAVLESQKEDEFFGVALRFGQSNSMTRDRFLGMINKQRLATGDRTHSQITMLDAVKGSLCYPGFQQDVDRCERLHGTCISHPYTQLLYRYLTFTPIKCDFPHCLRITSGKLRLSSMCLHSHCIF